MIRQQKTVDPALQINPAGSIWIEKEKLQLILVETITDLEYNNFANAMERLLTHPYSYRYEEFIKKYRRALTSQKAIVDIPKPDIDDKGRSYVTIYGELKLNFQFSAN
jgi:small subunit ribosomal protein S9